MEGSTIVLAICLLVICVIMILAIVRISSNVEEMNRTLSEINRKIENKEKSSTTSSTPPKTNPSVVNGKWICKNCGSSNDANTPYCKDCGEYK